MSRAEETNGTQHGSRTDSAVSSSKGQVEQRSKDDAVDGAAPELVFEWEDEANCRTVQQPVPRDSDVLTGTSTPISQSAFVRHYPLAYLMHDQGQHNPHLRPLWDILNSNGRSGDFIDRDQLERDRNVRFSPINLEFSHNDRQLVGTASALNRRLPLAGCTVQVKVTREAVAVYKAILQCQRDAGRGQ